MGGPCREWAGGTRDGVLPGGGGHERAHDGGGGDDSRRRAEEEPRVDQVQQTQFQDDRVREDPDDDGGDLCHDLDEESDREAHPVLPELGQIDSREHAGGKRDEGRQADEDERALDRVPDSALARGEREEPGTDRLQAAAPRFDEDAPERDQGEGHACEGRDAHHEVLQAPPGVAVEPEGHAASPTPITRRTISRAKMLIARDISMRTSPSSISALSSSGPASVKLLAIQLAIVWP